MSAITKTRFPKQAPRHQRGFLLLSLREGSMEGVKWEEGGQTPASPGASELRAHNTNRKEMVRKADEGLGPGQRTNAYLSPTSTAL